MTTTKVQLPATLRSTFCAKNTIEKLLPLPCVCQNTPPRPWPSLRASSIEAMALFTPRNWWFWPSILTSPALCSENSVKFSTRSSRRVRSQVPRSITSSDTRRGSSSRSMRFHSKKRSQSAVSEPTRLSVPLRGDEQRVEPEQRRDLLLVVGEVLVEGGARRHAGLLQLDHHQRQAVDEADEVGPAGVERAGDAELADQQEVVVLGLLPVDHAQALGLLAAVLAVGHGDRDAVLEQPIDLAVRRLQAHRRAVAGQLVDGGVDRLGRQRGLSRASAARRRATSTTSPLVSRPSVPPAPKVSSIADTVCQPSAANSPMAGCSTSWSSV